MYELYIANKNYSSWSLRPWVLMRTLGITFDEKLIPFVTGAANFTSFSPTGKVPCLLDNGTLVWDSLAIIEYLAERHQGVWAEDAALRAWSRSAAAEMHSGFIALRNHYTMNIGLRIKSSASDPALPVDIARIDTLWQEGLSKSGGPFLAGEAFTAVDAFYCPVAFRFQTFGASLSPASEDYAARLLQLPAMREWQDAALKETLRDPAHEEDARNMGEWLEDLRSTS